MLHSEYLSAANAALADVKSKVKYRGLNTAGGWIENPIDVPQKFAARVRSLNLGEERSAAYKGPFDPVRYIDEMARLAKDSNTGNCSELSAVAFKYLERTGIRPLEYFGVYRGSWNHAFLILNRDVSIPLTDFARWSYNAILCDPLYDRAADAGFLAPWYPKIVPFKAKDLFLRLE